MTEQQESLGVSGFQASPPAQLASEEEKNDDEEMPELEDVGQSAPKSGDSEEVEKEEEEEGKEETEEEKDEEKTIQDAEEQVHLTKEERQAIFLEGKALDEAGDLDSAFDKFTACLAGVRPDSAFPELPACLRSLAEIAYRKDEFEKAVHFIQAEKMYYEAALLDTSVLQSMLNKDVKKSLMEDKDDANLQKLRANEYETLAKFCIEKKQLQLALEYSAKAAKLREAVFGEEHEETTRSLDFMTSIYTDLGRQEYAESLEKFEQAKQSEDTPPAPTEPSESSRPSSGQPQQAESMNREIRISLIFFSVMIFVACGVLVFVCLYAYCELTYTNRCDTFVKSILDNFNWLHFLVHRWLPI